MDHKVCDTLKQLNALKHQSATKQKKLEQLQTQYNQMVKDASEAVATDKGESEDAQVSFCFFIYVFIKFCACFTDILWYPWKRRKHHASLCNSKN